MNDDTATTDEIWIGVISPLSGDELVALAWVRRRDEWLADAGTARREDGVAELGRMYLAAVASRGHGPDRLTIRDAADAAALTAIIGPDVTIDVAFDTRAGELADAATDAIEVTFGAQQLAREDAQRSRLYARMHAAVEAQIERDDPPKTAETLARLQAAGADRDAAIHLIAAVFMRAMHDVLVTGAPFDAEGYAAALDELQAD